MADENAGGTVNIISVGMGTAQLEADANKVKSTIRSLQYELKKLEKLGQSDSSRASNLKQEVANQKAALESIRLSIKAAKDEAKAKLEVAEATQKATQATLRYSAAQGAGRISASQRTTTTLAEVKALAEKAAALKVIAAQEEQMFRVLKAGNAAAVASTQQLASYRAAYNKSVLADEARIQSVITATTRAREAGVEALRKYNEGLARSIRVDESAGQRAIEARNTKIQQGVAYLRAWQAEQDKTTQALGRTMSVAQEMDKRLTFKRQRDEATQLFNSVKLTSDQYNTLGRTIAGVKAVVDRFGPEGLNLLPASSRAYATLIPTLEQYKRKITDVGAASRTTAGHTHAAALAHDALHSAARGVSGVLGGLWLTYARMLPVLLGVAAATKLVKDSISGGLDVGFATQFAAILQTENMLGKGQSDAYTNLAALRDDIRKSLISISRESVFTVEQNAQALQKLSLAGVNAQKGLELLTTASNVAVLAQGDLGKATTMVLDTLYNFGMASESSITMAENYAKASDIMAFTANTVNASFEDIARSFENITGVAGTFNVTIEEASALLQSLAKTGIRGSKAGTYVRNFMDDLLGAPISQRAEKQLDSLNIERYNADLYGEGDFGAAKYIDELVESLSKLGFVEQQNAIRAITNQRSRRVLRQELIEYKNGLKEVNGELKQTNSLYDRTVKLQADAQGSLARMAEGLTGDTKYQFIMAQSAYNAAVNEAYLYAESDLRGAAQSLQALFRSDEFREMVTGLVTGFASLAKGAAEFAAQAMDLAKYLDGLGGVLATVAKYATALGGAFLAIKGYAAVSATIAGLGGAAAAAAAGVKLLNTALLANPAIAVGTALVATLVYLDQWYEKSKKYEQSLAGRQAKLDELRKAEAEYAAQVERKQSGNRDWLDSLFPEKKLAETRAEIKATVDSIAADMNSALDSVSFQSSFDKILNETDTFLTNMRNAARQAGGDFETEYRNKLVRSIEDADETLKAYAETVANLDQSSAAGKQFAAFMTAWLSGISERAMIAGEELGRLNLILSNQSLKSAAEGLEFGVKDLSQLESANEELMKSIRALELGEDGLFRYQQEQKKTQLASLENAYAALEFAYSMAAAANAPLAVLEQMQAQMVATAINMGRLTDNIALSQRERELTPAKRGPRPDRDPIRAQLEEARTAIQDFKNSYSEMLGSIQDSTKDLAIGPLEAYERSMRAAAEAYDQMFAAITKAKNTSGLSANDRQKLQTDENKLLGEANKETRRLVEEYQEILEDRSKNLEELEIATGRKVLGAAESWLREYANKYGETVTLLQSDIANLETKLKVAVETGQSDEEVARLTTALKVLQDQLASFGKSATLGAWAADIEESIDIAEKTLESFSQTLDRMADKSSKEGLFGTLSGNAAAFEAAKAQYVRGLQESINEIKRKIREAEQQGALELKAELKIRLDNLEGDLQDASERIDPILEGWGDSLGDYIANGIVYGFDQGESPAKAFANMLRREIYKSIASALSKQFTLSLNNIFGGGGSSGTGFLTSAFNAVFSRSGSGAAAAGASPAGAGSSGGLGGFNPMSLLGGNSTGMGISNAATWLAQSNMLAGTGVGNYLTGFAGNAAGMSNLALGGAGLLGGIGANFLFGGKGYSSTGGSLGSTVGMIAGGPLGAAVGGLLGGAIGSLFGGGKPSDKSSWATVDPRSRAITSVGSMTGKKDPGQKARDNTKSLAEFIGGFAGLAGISSSITAMAGQRDGLRLSINRAEGTRGFRTPGAGLANGGNALNYGYGDEAIRKMLDDLVDEGTLPRPVIDSWRAMKTDMTGTARDATELVSTLNLLVQGYDRASIERANLLQQEGEALESAMGRVVSIENALKGVTLPGTELANNAGAMVAQLKNLSLSAIPTSVEQFRALIGGLDLTAAGGREAYVSLMNLAPAFIEIQKAQETLYSQLLTDDENTSRAARALSTAFRELGVSMPGSRDELRRMIDAQDQTTQSGAILRAQLLGLVPAFLEVGAAVERATGAAREAAEEAARTARQMAEQEVAAAQRTVEETARTALQLAQSAVSSARGRAETAGTAARDMATQNLSNAQSASNEARSTAEDSARRAVQLAENELSAALASADQYKTLRKDLVSGTFSPLSEMEVAEWSGNNYRDTLSRARGGDSQALSDLPGAARSFLESKMQTATSAEDYIRAYAGVQANAAELEGSALNDVELARAQLESVKSQTGVLIDIKDEITTVAEALSVFGADYIKYVDSQGAVSTAQSELDRVNSVISSLVPESEQFGSVDEALAAFNTAFSDLTSAEGFLERVKSEVEGFTDISEPARSAAEALTEFNDALRALTSAEGLLETVNKETSVLLPPEEGVTSAADALEVFRDKLLEYSSLTAELTAEPPPEPAYQQPTLLPPVIVAQPVVQPVVQPAEPASTGLAGKLLDTLQQNWWQSGLRIDGGFAKGGMHKGGLRLVGENGPELEVTGPARIWNYDQTRNLLAGAGGGRDNGALLVELAALRAEVAQLRAATEATAMNTHEFKKQISRWDQEGMPGARETV